MVEQSVLRSIEAALFYAAQNNETWVRDGGNYICHCRTGIYVNGQEFQTLALGVNAIFKHNDSMILLLLDPALNHQEIVSTFSALQDAGLKKLQVESLATYGSHT
jgi:hypothetical protein